MSKKKVQQSKTFLFITNTDYTGSKLTGAHRRFLELINSVSKKNSVILISGKIPELKNYSLQQIPIKSISGRFLPSHVKRIIEIGYTLRRKKDEVQYDYAVSFGPIDTVCYAISGYKNIVTLFREDFLGYRKAVNTSAIKMIYFKMIEKYAVKHSEKIIVQCKDDKDALVDRYSTGKNRMPKIYVQINNINASWMKKGKKTTKKKEGLINIAFVGNFSDNRKGHHLLLPAVKRLIDEGYNIHLYVAGDGNQLEKYKKLYESYGGIMFLGRLKDVSKLFLESDFEIVPSIMDSCPNTVLEGINSGIAVYGSNVGGIKEILQKKEYLFEPTIDAVYMFIKKVIDGKKFVDDAIAQRSIKKRLTFDWGDAIIKIIEGND